LLGHDGGPTWREQQQMRQFIQRNLRRIGLELQRTGPKHDVMEFVRDREIDVVLDVGANVGQFGESLRAKGYRGTIVSFEPIPHVYQVLAEKATADRDWEVNNFALGATAEQATINVADATVFSSMLPTTTAATEFDDTAAVTHGETIEVRKLDDVFPAVSGNVLLKIDTQGYEKQVLEGGRHLLPMVKGVLMELPIIHLYEGTWRLHQAIEFMEEAGFVPAQIHPVNYHSTDGVSLVEVDCLFRPRDSRVD
jgi:FkbM family methyltransferase